MKDRESFIFYRSWLDAIKNLPRDVQGEVLTAIVEYGLNGATTGQLKPITKAMLTMAKAQIDANNVKFINGSKGGAPKGVRNNPNGRNGKSGTNQELTETNQELTENKPRTNQELTKTNLMYNVNVNDNDNKENPPKGGSKKAELSSPPCREKIDYTKLKDYFNNFAKQAGIPQISALTEARKAAIRARVAQYDKETIGTVMRKVTESDFLRGKNDRNWQATFDWIFKQQNFTRILDGEFDNKKHRTGYTAKYGDVNDEWK